ncbi:MAG: hypothetical protein WA816_00575 [Bacteroidales bacterium]
MASKGIIRYYLLLIFLISGLLSFGQNVSPGIYYQAVARDNSGKELVNKNIDVKFSIIIGNPLGTVVYQELYSDISTSKFGIFSLIIGRGTPTGGIYTDLSQIQWNTASHYLKVEVKFDNDFIEMGTMEFLAVPYALYAQKSLEPGPQGPKGDPGDPASDKQTLSFDGNNLSISNGNTVNLATLNVPHQLTLIGDTLSILGGNKVGLTNQIQDLQLDINNVLKITKNPSATAIDLSPFKQNLSYNSATGILSLSNGTGADLSSLKTAAIQDIHLNGNQLSIDKNSSSTGVDLSKYMDNTDNQTLAYNSANNSLTITNGNTVSLGDMIAFRAAKTVATSAPMPLSNIDFLPDQLEYNDGNSLNIGTGEFTAPSTSIYTFDVKYIDPNDGGAGRKLMLFKNGNLYDYLESVIGAGSAISRTITIKLVASDKIKVVIYTGTGTGIGTGNFSGYKVY